MPLFAFKHLYMPKPDPSQTSEPSKLTTKQKLFIEFYLGEARGNGAEAARMAGYQATKRESLRQIAYENLKNPEIRTAIDSRVDEVAMSSHEVLARLAEHARGDLGDFLEAKTYGKPVITLDKAKAEGKTHLIKRYASGPKGNEIELYDAQAALVTLGKYHRLWIERTEVSGLEGGPVVVKKLKGKTSADKLLGGKGQ